MYNLTQNPNKPICRQAGAISFIEMLANIEKQTKWTQTKLSTARNVEQQ